MVQRNPDPGHRPVSLPEKHREVKVVEDWDRERGGRGRMRRSPFFGPPQATATARRWAVMAARGEG